MLYYLIEVGKLIHIMFCHATLRINEIYVSCFIHREVVVGEYVVGEDPDCERGRCSPPIQKFGVEKVINHENWDASRKGFLKGNDIALVRLDGYITLFLVST